MKNKTTKIRNSKKNPKRKVANQMGKSKDQTIKPKNNNCFIPNLVPAISYVDNVEVNLV